jgi:hypothetical protein
MLPAVMNFSSFSTDIQALVDAYARQFYIIVLSAAFDTAPDGRTRIARQQPPPVDQDVYYGDPTRSSVRYDADFAFEKLKVDVVVNGSAYAPPGRAVPQLAVTLRIVGMIQKVLIVSGDRFVMDGNGRPEPFAEMPIRYERAYGGSTDTSHEPRNPVGIGHRGCRSADAAVRSGVANISYPGDLPKWPGDRVKPAGFGFIARGWAPRLGYAGTFDEKWQQNQFPLLPIDFDNRFWQAAPADQQLNELRGGEVVEILNMTPDRRWTFIIPALDVPLSLRFCDRVEETRFSVDTVVIEPAAHRFILKGRRLIPVPSRGSPLQEVVVGQATSGWWRARVTGKRYIDSAARADRGAREK